MVAFVVHLFVCIVNIFALSAAFASMPMQYPPTVIRDHLEMIKSANDFLVYAEPVLKHLNSSGDRQLQILARDLLVAVTYIRQFRENFPHKFITEAGNSTITTNKNLRRTLKDKQYPDKVTESVSNSTLDAFRESEFLLSPCVCCGLSQDDCFNVNLEEGDGDCEQDSDVCRGCLVCGLPYSCEEKFLREGWGKAACCEKPEDNDGETFSSNSGVSAQNSSYSSVDFCAGNPCSEHGSCKSNASCSEVVLKSNFAFSANEGCFKANAGDEYGSCSSCGYSVDVISVIAPFNCITCASGYEIDVVFDDCTVCCISRCFRV